jgi:hypothetical protein
VVARVVDPLARQLQAMANLSDRSELTLNSRSRATGIGERIFCYCPIDLAATKLPLTLVLQDPVLPEDSLQLIMW